MGFWGVEVKPGKAYTHIYDQSSGRLRLSQATLGIGKSTGKSLLQCNVGDKAPVLLCSLIPERNETCNLDLEFEERNSVVFSVIGQRSIHLAGYFKGSFGHGFGGDDDSDSYGVDIANTESDDSESYGGEEDEYESDFIDDGDIEMFSSSSPRKSNVVIEEILDDDKPSNGNHNVKHSKKNYQVSDSDDDAPKRQLVRRRNGAVIDSEDEDGFPIFSSKMNKTVNNADKSAKSQANLLEDKERKVDVISSDAEPDRVEIATDSTEKSKKKKKGKSKNKKQETATQRTNDKEVSGDENQGLENNLTSAALEDQEVTVNEEAATTESIGKLKKRMKVKKEKSSHNLVLFPEEKAEGEQLGQDGSTNEHSKNEDAVDQDTSVEPNKLLNEKEVSAHESSGKSKKKSKKRKTEEVDAINKNEENGKINEDAVIPKQSNNQVSAESPAANEKGSKKKKKSKNQENDSTAKQQLLTGEQDDDLKSMQKRVFANGLTVEQLSIGKPDGKRASRGNKVLVSYIGKLKNGKIFDSTVGKKPFQFRLGIGEVIKGWDVGVEGMRIGDKRRLTVPPSMGYGSKAAGPIPPNSWLIFEVELVDVK